MKAPPVPVGYQGAWGTMPGGSEREKGPGFLGTLQRPDGQVSSELSIGVEMDGKEIEIPSLVPTLTKDEVDHMLAGKKPTDAIVDKAVAHAKKRMAEGKKVFAQLGEQSSANRPGKIRMVSPSGQSGWLAENEVEDALNNGWRRQ
jgi:hypothetical protein